MGKKRVSRRSKGLRDDGNKFDTDPDPDLLKSGAGCSRESVAWIPSPAVEEYDADINKLKKHLKDAEEEASRLKADSNKERADLERQIAGLEKKVQDLSEQKEHVLTELELKKDMREALAVFKRSPDDEDRCLMDEAQQRFPEQFPKQSQDLIKLAKLLFSWLCEPHNIDKIWDLMKLAHNLIPEYISAEVFKKLMMKTYDSYRGGFPGDQLRMKVQESEDYKVHTGKVVNALSNLIHQWVPSKDVHVNLVDLIILTRNLFPRYLPHKKFHELLEKAHELFEKNKFPPVPVYHTFTGPVAILERCESSVKDKKLLMTIKDMLARLQSVAMEFKWPQSQLSNATLGNQFFYLSKDVALSNRVVFHKELEVAQVMANAREGIYKVGDHNVGLAIVACLKPRQTQKKEELGSSKGPE